MTSSAYVSSSSTLPPPSPLRGAHRRATTASSLAPPCLTSRSRRDHAFHIRATKDSNRTEAEVIGSEADRLVDGMDFGELCNEFECISSPLVESTARQLLRDILELRRGDRAFGSYAITVAYKDPVRSFTGRDKYKRPLWVTGALEKPSVSVQEMAMLSTSVLNIKWTVRGKPKSFVAAIAGDLVIKVNSQFTLNQISGQVIEHEESWDLSETSQIGRAFFWASKRLFATSESAKDLSELLNKMGTRTSTGKENLEMYPDLIPDPTKFFQRNDDFQRDFYQLALLLAVLYFVVQFLKITL